MSHTKQLNTILEASNEDSQGFFLYYFATVPLTNMEKTQ